jgi:hypothetical protein
MNARSAERARVSGAFAAPLARRSRSTPPDADHPSHQGSSGGADRIFVPSRQIASCCEARLRRDAIACRVIDETRAPVLDPGRKATKSGFFRAVVSDDRSHGGASPPIVLFHYASGRGKEHPLKFLAGYCGRLPHNATPVSPATR